MMALDGNAHVLMLFCVQSRIVSIIQNTGVRVRVENSN